MWKWGKLFVVRYFGIVKLPHCDVVIFLCTFFINSPLVYFKFEFEFEFWIFMFYYMKSVFKSIKIVNYVYIVNVKFTIIFFESPK